MGVWVSYHHMAHCVLIRCLLQPSLAEALCRRTLSAIFTDRTPPGCESCYILFHKISGKCENLPEKLADYVKIYLKNEWIT